MALIAALQVIPKKLQKAQASHNSRHWWQVQRTVAELLHGCILQLTLNLLEIYYNIYYDIIVSI